MTAFAGIQGPDYRLNSGGPRSRTRVERIKTSILGLPDGPVICPCREVLALCFGDAEPVTSMYRILGSIGLSDPEQLRATFGRGVAPRLCRADPDLYGLDIEAADAFDVLRTGFMLGLCTGVLLDPERPVLWTQASLTRRLELFDMGGFYL